MPNQKPQISHDTLAAPLREALFRLARLAGDLPDGDPLGTQRGALKAAADLRAVAAIYEAVGHGAALAPFFSPPSILDLADEIYAARQPRRV